MIVFDNIATIYILVDNYSTLIEYCVLNIGYWILLTEYWILDIGYWILDIGYWILNFGIVNWAFFYCSQNVENRAFGDIFS